MVVIDDFLRKPAFVVSAFLPQELSEFVIFLMRVHGSLLGWRGAWASRL
jgi:hypothetical protein